MLLEDKKHGPRRLQKALIDAAETVVDPEIDNVTDPNIKVGSWESKGKRTHRVCACFFFC